MEINLNINNGFGNVGMGQGPAEAANVESRPGKGGALSVTSADVRLGGIAASEPTANVPDSALVRDDALGKLVDSAFSLPPPPMPAFSE